MSALPTSEERMVNPGIPGSSTLPHGVDGYTLVQVREYVCVRARTHTSKGINSPFNQRTEKGMTVGEVGRNQSFMSNSTPMVSDIPLHLNNIISTLFSLLISPPPLSDKPQFNYRQSRKTWCPD